MHLVNSPAAPGPRAIVAREAELGPEVEQVRAVGLARSVLKVPRGHKASMAPTVSMAQLAQPEQLDLLVPESSPNSSR